MTKVLKAVGKQSDDVHMAYLSQAQEFVSENQNC